MLKKIALIGCYTGAVLLLFSILASPLIAQGGIFYELNPDYYLTFPLPVVQSQNLFLYLQPQNDFLSGFDFWLDNVGGAGTATFVLHNAQNSIVAAKTINISTTLPSPGGTRVHIDLENAVQVSNTEVYDLEIATAMPDLRFYYADNVKVIQHSSPVLSPYLTGVTEINNVRQDFVIKFALYEDNDTQPPQISNFLVTQQDSNTVSLSFNANEPVDYKIDYGLASGDKNLGFPYQNTFEACAGGITTCSFLLNIEPEKLYSYTIGVMDSWGNQAFFSGQFLMHALATSTPPVNPPPPVTPPATTPPPPSSPLSTKFSIGDRAQVTATLNVRSNAVSAANLLGTQYQGALGTIAGGPTLADNFSWWYVNYDNAPKGWSVENNLELVAAPPPGTPMPEDNPLSVVTTTTKNSLGVSWTPNAGDATGSSYTISIVGEKTGLKKQFVVAPGVSSVNFSELPDDNYRVSISKNGASGVINVAEQTVVVSKHSAKTEAGFSFSSFALKWFLPLGVLILLGIGIYFLRRLL